MVRYYIPEQSLASWLSLLIGVAGHGEGYKVPTEINGVPFDPSTENAAVELLTGKVLDFYILDLTILYSFVCLTGRIPYSHTSVSATGIR